MQNRLKPEEWARRIAGASEGQLIVIHYEIILSYLDGALEAVEMQDTEAYQKNIEKTVQFLHELIDSLDFEYEIAGQLFDLYKYVNKLLMDLRRKENIEKISECKTILSKLLEAWKQIEDQGSEKVLENTPQVYAGLTYGKNQLNENVMGEENRGFKA